MHGLWGNQLLAAVTRLHFTLTIKGQLSESTHAGTARATADSRHSVPACNFPVADADVLIYLTLLKHVEI